MQSQYLLTFELENTFYQSQYLLTFQFFIFGAGSERLGLSYAPSYIDVLCTQGAVRGHMKGLLFSTSQVAVCVGGCGCGCLCVYVVCMYI